VDVTMGLTSKGAGVAQIDSYELIFISRDSYELVFVSRDDPESGRGSNNPGSDFRYIG
jgi:hypothetical protein